MSDRVIINVSLTLDVHDALVKFASDQNVGGNKRTVAQQAEGCISEVLIKHGYYEIPDTPQHVLDKWEAFKRQQEGKS